MAGVRTRRAPCPTGCRLPATACWRTRRSATTTAPPCSAPHNRSRATQAALACRRHADRDAQPDRRALHAERRAAGQRHGKRPGSASRRRCRAGRQGRPASSARARLRYCRYGRPAPAGPLPRRAAAARTTAAGRRQHAGWTTGAHAAVLGCAGLAPDAVAGRHAQFDGLHPARRLARRRPSRGHARSPGCSSGSGSFSGPGLVHQHACTVRLVADDAGDQARRSKNRGQDQPRDGSRCRARRSIRATNSARARQRDAVVDDPGRLRRGRCRTGGA